MSVARTALAATPRIAFAFDPPLLRAALAAGLMAGSAALLLMQWMATVAYDESPWKLPRMMAALVRGPAALGDDFDATLVTFGFAIHYALSFLYAVVLGHFLARSRREHAALVGIAFGTLLYTTNVHALSAFFPWFAEMRTPDTLVAHMVFGLVAACAFSEYSQHPAANDIA